jgi:hypothetical protein
MKLETLSCEEVHSVIQVLWEKYISLSEIHCQLIYAHGDGVRKSAVCRKWYKAGVLKLFGDVPL